MTFFEKTQVCLIERSRPAITNSFTDTNYEVLTAYPLLTAFSVSIAKTTPAAKSIVKSIQDTVPTFLIPSTSENNAVQSPVKSQA